MFWLLALGVVVALVPLCIALIVLETEMRDQMPTPTTRRRWVYTADRVTGAETRVKAAAGLASSTRTCPPPGETTAHPEAIR